ncbi:unnamed protein product, partial [Ixodes hexagonus]
DSWGSDHLPIIIGKPPKPHSRPATSWTGRSTEDSWTNWYTLAHPLPPRTSPKHLKKPREWYSNSDTSSGFSGCQATVASKETRPPTRWPTSPT